MSYLFTLITHSVPSKHFLSLSNNIHTVSNCIPISAYKPVIKITLNIYFLNTTYALIIYRQIHLLFLSYSLSFSLVIILTSVLAIVKINTAGPFCPSTDFF
ncbi:hypothetical protein FKM82_021767 [Ascaphus truei]